MFQLMAHDRREVRSTCIVSAIIGLLACGLSSQHAVGLMVNHREIPVFATTGDGGSVSYLLVDFGGATPAGDSYLFAYYYDIGTPAKTGLDLINDLSFSTPLDVELQNFGFGEFVAGLGIENVITDMPQFSADGRYWEYWLGSHSASAGGTVIWASSQIGISDRILTNGSIDGWYASRGGVKPRFPGADLNGDGRVDGSDVVIVFGDWGPNASVANLNNDLIVDGADLGILYSAWTGDAGAQTASVPEPIWGGVPALLWFVCCRRAVAGRR
ncbi:MAG: hypothetical protein O2931_00985 [Planctomycetota bacterium]|nr:hypothetical protein [Planctomycetota bacterium]